MRWITSKQVVKAAEKGHKAALQCSLKHWEQLVKAKPRELLGKYWADDLIYKMKYCSLCQLYYQGGLTRRDNLLDDHPHDCGKCPLRPKSQDFGCGNNSLWLKAHLSFCDWYYEKNTKNWEKWQINAQKLRDKLQKELNR